MGHDAISGKDSIFHSRVSTMTHLARREPLIPTPQPRLQHRTGGRVRLLAALLLIATAAAPLRAQRGCVITDDSGRRCGDVGDSDQRAGQAATILGLNAVTGGLTGGILQKIRGGSFWDGFGKGALGGAVIFAGKRIAVESFDGAGFAGREVAAVGGSMVRNGGAAQGLLSELVLPLGPSRLYVRPGEASPLRLQVDAAALVVLGAALLDDRYRLDGGASLSAGAPVFRQRRDGEPEPWVGRASTGVIRLSARLEMESPATRRDVAAHERIHVLQYDQGFLSVGEPLERAVLPLIPGGFILSRHLDVGLELPLWALAHRMVDYHERPWEREADLLSGTGAASVEESGGGRVPWVEMGGW